MVGAFLFNLVSKASVMKIISTLVGILAPLFVSAQVQVIENINLIDVKTGKTSPGMSVMISGNTITQIGATKSLKKPEGALTLSGEGKYLIPGLIDSHVHFFQSGSIYTRPDAVSFQGKPYEEEMAFVRRMTPDHLTRYLRLGITTVADVGGPMWNFSVRDSISKSVPGPNVYVTGPLFSMVSRDALGKKDPPIVKITTITQADSLFAKLMARKPDFIKVWYIAGPQLPAEKNFELVKHIARRTHENNLKLCVHATQQKTAELAVDAGADILVHSVDDAVLTDSFLKKLKEKRVTVIPTLIVSHGYRTAFARKLRHDPQDLAWANPFVYGTLTDPEKMDEASWPPVIKRMSASGIPRSAATSDSVMSINLRKMVSGGVNVASGTDAGNIGTMHASSYLQELQAMVAAGLTTSEVLKASTINAALGFGWPTLGSIEKGKLADLVILGKNPLEKIENLNAIDYIVKGGRIIKADTLLKETPEALVQRQLNAYNARNLEAFLDTYDDDVELYNFPDQLTNKGKAEMRKRYEPFFASATNLYCEVVTRMVLGNKIIDQEKVRAGSKVLKAAAVYEIEKGKIKRVTFIRP